MPKTNSPFGERILIAVPHPDDEVVGFCAAIQRAKAAGASIFAVYLTNGCIARQTLWPWQRKNYESNVIRRLHEAIDVARILGITPLSFSDRPARHLWRNLADVRVELERMIQAHKIDQLWVPAYEGGNADHDGLNGLSATLTDQVKVLEFALYNYYDGKAQPQTFPFANGSERVIELSEEEQLFKQKMLAAYVSEQQNLGYVGTQRECYRPLASYDYVGPPHKGTLWYTRFHWVPFAHPRIDFSTPDQVSAAIKELHRDVT